MFYFDKKSTHRIYTPWGIAVKKGLIDKGMKQQDLVRALVAKGYNINKIIVSNLLYGICATARVAEIKEISRILDIPFEDK